MKRIIDGVTYNTDTSTKVARWEEKDWRGENPEEIQTLYLTRGGAFFLVVEKGPWGWDEDTQELVAGTATFEPQTRQEAHKWTLEGEIEVFDDQALEMPPEAEAEQPGSSAATLYIRVPVSLRDRITKAAAAKQESMNAFALRCLERCLEA